MPVAAAAAAAAHFPAVPSELLSCTVSALTAHWSSTCIDARICGKGSEDHLSKSSVVGILTERDLVYALSGGFKNLETKTVKDIMTRKLIFTCNNIF